MKMLYFFLSKIKQPHTEATKAAYVGPLLCENVQSKTDLDDREILSDDSKWGILYLPGKIQLLPGPLSHLTFLMC